MIISNVFVPLVGLVDTAIVGHLPGPHHLAGVALGSLIITQLLWLCGFLRMSTTGLSAISYGGEDIESSATTLKSVGLLALVIGGYSSVSISRYLIWGCIFRVLLLQSNQLHRLIFIPSYQFPC